MALTDHLVSWWDLEEESGQRNDAHGTNHLTSVNGVGAAAGKVGQAASFVAASSQYLSRASNSSLQVGDIAFAFALWVYLTDVATPHYILNKRAGAQDEYALLYNNSGGTAYLEWYIWQGASSYRVQIPFSTPGTWVFIVAWFDPTAGRIYLSLNNNTPYSTVVPGGGVNVSDGAFNLGRYAGGGFHHNGRIDSVGYWKGGIPTGTERTQLYNSGAGVRYSDFASSPIQMAGAAAATASATATLLRRILASAQAQGITAATAGLQALRRLSAQAQSDAAAQAALSVARQLSGAAAADAGADAQAQRDVLLAAVAGAVGGASGTLVTDSAILLSATAAAAGDATAALSVERILSARSEADARAQAGLVIERLLSALAAGAAGATAALQAGEVPFTLPERRTYRVPYENRTYRVPRENRIYRVPRQNRVVVA